MKIDKPIYEMHLKFDNKQIKTTINTSGFGYDMESSLLDDLAIEIYGNYSFIPDSSLVGTIFVNTLSKFLCTFVN